MTDDTCPALPMAQTCEHFYASHCYRGMSVRLCMLCHEPDWDDLAGQAESSAAEPADRSADATGPAESNWRERAERAEAKLAEIDVYVTGAQDHAKSQTILAIIRSTEADHG